MNLLGRLYRILLRAYPRHFRRLYGDEMYRVCRDRARQTHGLPDLVRFAALVFQDWLATVIEERISIMPPLRIGFAAAIALDIALLLVRIKPSLPAVIASLAAVPFVLLVMYGLIGLWALSNRNLTLATTLGLLAGAAVTLSTLLGPFAMLAAFGLMAFAGFKNPTEPLLAGSWCGLIAALATATVKLCLISAHWMPVGFAPPSQWPDPYLWFSQVMLSASGQHLLLGPLAGAALGWLAGFAPRKLSRESA